MFDTLYELTGYAWQVGAAVSDNIMLRSEISWWTEACERSASNDVWPAKKA